MQIEIGNEIFNTILLVILVGWGFARVAEVWLNVFEKIKKLWKRKEREG